MSDHTTDKRVVHFISSTAAFMVVINISLCYAVLWLVGQPLVPTQSVLKTIQCAMRTDLDSYDKIVDEVKLDRK